MTNPNIVFGACRLALGAAEPTFSDGLGAGFFGPNFQLQPAQAAPELDANSAAIPLAIVSTALCCVFGRRRLARQD
ncbi:MAG TPA: hypothetical protein VGO93_11465 [Candidatus Xenobia bacterium]